MNIALYQRYSGHTEIIGSFLELLEDIPCNIFIYYYTRDKLNWVKYYTDLFTNTNRNKTIEQNNEQNNNQNTNRNKTNEQNTNQNNIISYESSQIIKDMMKLDLIIFLSSGDINQYWVKEYLSIKGKRIITIPHVPKHPHPNDNISIVLTPILKNINNGNDVHYILPIYNKIPANLHENKMCILGVVGLCDENNKDIKDLELLIDTVDPSKFLVYIFTRGSNISRRLINKYKFSNVMVFENIGSSEMVRKLEMCKFILPLPSKDSWYYKDRLTGVIPLAINNNIPMVLPNKLKEIYDLKGCISYDSSLLEIIDEVVNISEDKYNHILQEMYNWKTKVCLENKKVFNYFCLSQ